MKILAYRDRIKRATQFLLPKIPFHPRWCVVLGSGLGGLSEHLSKPVVKFPYSDIPGFPKTTVQGHTGELVFGLAGNQCIAVMEGRFHAYEGHAFSTLVLPTRVLLSLGAENFFITNAAGGIREDLAPGNLMLITDHLNLMGGNPLTGPNLDELGPRFPAMTHCYDPHFRSATLKIAAGHGHSFKQGIYAALPGPNYETNAEIEMIRRLGGDAVGMSTVPEILAIRHAGCRAVAVSLITNATGGENVPTHDEVVSMADRVRPDLHQIILDVIHHSGTIKDS